MARRLNRLVTVRLHDSWRVRQIMSARAPPSVTTDESTLPSPLRSMQWSSGRKCEETWRVEYSAHGARWDIGAELKPYQCSLVEAAREEASPGRALRELDPGVGEPHFPSRHTSTRAFFSFTCLC